MLQRIADGAFGAIPTVATSDAATRKGVARGARTTIRIDAALDASEPIDGAEASASGAVALSVVVACDADLAAHIAAMG
jgi:hypothetical protein